jgi:hypothetical protein
MTGTGTHIFRATWRPKVYREFEILSAKTLYDLGEEIVRVFGFDFDHAFGFYSKLTGFVYDSPVQYELFADIGESKGRGVERTRITEAFSVIGAKMTFLFDYGDEWLFRIEVLDLKRKEPKVRYPRLLKSIGAAPEQYPDPDEE